MMIPNQNKTITRYNLVSNILGESGVIIKGRDYIFNQCGDSVNLDINEASEFVNSDKYKQLFNVGVFYFKEDDIYEHFGLTKGRILNTDYYINLLSKTPEEVVKELSDLTDNKSWGKLLHIMMYRIANLIKNKKVKIDSDLVKAINDFYKSNDNDFDIMEMADYSELKLYNAVGIKEEKDNK